MVKTHLNLSYSCEINVCIKYNNQTLLFNALFKSTCFSKNGTEMDIIPHGSISELVWTIFP